MQIKRGLKCLIEDHCVDLPTKPLDWLKVLQIMKDWKYMKIQDFSKDASEDINGDNFLVMVIKMIIFITQLISPVLQFYFLQNCEHVHHIHAALLQLNDGECSVVRLIHFCFSEFQRSCFNEEERLLEDFKGELGCEVLKGGDRPRFRFDQNTKRDFGSRMI